MVEKCTSTFSKDRGENVQKMPLNEQAKRYILEDIFDGQMAKKNLRGMAFAYSDMSFGDWDQLMGNIEGDFDSEHEIAYLERNLTFLACVGLKDPLRSNIKDTVSTVTGMNI